MAFTEFEDAVESSVQIADQERDAQLNHASLTFTIANDSYSLQLLLSVENTLPQTRNSIHPINTMPHSERPAASNTGAQNGETAHGGSSGSSSGGGPNRPSPAVDRWLGERSWEEPYHGQQLRNEGQEKNQATSNGKDGK